LINLSKKAQTEVINEIEKQASANIMQFSTVLPVENYANDPRIALTSVHFPKNFFKEAIFDKILKPLKQISPDHYYYPSDSLHLTIKNIRLINDPPTFNEEDVIR